KLIASRLIGDEICWKRVLGANRFSHPIGADTTIIDGARRPIEVGTGLPEMLLKESQLLPFEVEPRPDPQRLHLPGRRGPDAVKLPDRQRLDEPWSHFRRDDEEPVRFVVV